MGSVIRAQILNVQLRYNVTGNRLTCNLNYATNAAVDVNDPYALVNSWVTNVLPVWQALVSSDVTFDSIYATGDAPGVARPHELMLNATVGGAAAEAIPENLGMVFRLTQYETNSKHNGRIYIAGLAEGDVVDSLVTAGVMGSTALDLKVALMLTLAGYAGNNFNLCSVSRRAAGVPITAVGWYTSAIVATRSLCTQSRRTTELTSLT